MSAFVKIAPGEPIGTIVSKPLIVYQDNPNNPDSYVTKQGFKLKKDYIFSPIEQSGGKRKSRRSRKRKSASRKKSSYRR